MIMRPKAATAILADHEKANLISQTGLY